MIALDTSSFVAFIQEDDGTDTRIIEQAFNAGRVVLPPAVITEILCDPKLETQHREGIATLPILEVTSGFWRRAADTRRKLLMANLRARLGDALVAQSCIDHDVPLVTRDKDFKKMAKHLKLKLLNE